MTGGWPGNCQDTKYASVQAMGWAGIKNGKPLGLAQNRFQVFITGDRNLSFQQHLPNFAIAVVVLQAPGVQLIHTRPRMPKVLALLPALQPGSVVTVAI